MTEMESLIALSRLDQDLSRMREDAARVPRAIAKVERRLRDAEAARDAVRAAHEHAVRDRRGKERTVEEIEGERRRFERQLLEVKKNEEYAALLHEIEARKAAKETAETAILTLLDTEDVSAR